mmetsp:Transcript_44/g.73  ORF Transcript_44/g.73 Transcript_44/m.73 type:complete len:155 (+) Transcript_44:1461-1925(+)
MSRYGDDFDGGSRSRKRKTSNIDDIVGKWEIRYENKFKTHYEILENGRLFLPKRPPRPDTSRRRLYGETIHGWNGEALVTRRGSVFYFHPRGFHPFGDIDELSETSWEKVEVYREKGGLRLITKFHKGRKYVTSGEGWKILDSGNYDDRKMLTD